MDTAEIIGLVLVVGINVAASGYNLYIALAKKGEIAPPVIDEERKAKQASELNELMLNMGRTIQKLTEQQEEVAKVGKDLQFVLAGPKSRGTFGETILEELLEKLLPGAWERQYAIQGLPVDAVVKLKGVVYPIDAKFPKEDYQRYLSATDESSKKAAWNSHIAACKAQIDSIAVKYVHPQAGTADFALMFVPSETMYYDSIADTDPFDRPNTLMAYAYKQKVVPAGPACLFAFLMVIAKAQEGQRLVEGTKALQKLLAHVQTAFDHFYARYEEVGKHLNKAAESYRVGDGHIQRFKEKVQAAVTLRDGSDE